MEIERSLSDLAASLAPYKIALATGTDSNGRGRYVHFSAAGSPFCSVSVDDLYDADGNLFTDDL